MRKKSTSNKIVAFLLMLVLLLQSGASFVSASAGSSEPQPELTFLYQGSPAEDSLTIEIEPDEKITTDAASQGITVSSTYDDSAYDVKLEQTEGDTEIRLTAGESEKAVYTAQAVQKDDQSIAATKTLTVTYQAQGAESTANTVSTQSVDSSSEASGTSRTSGTSESAAEESEQIDVYIRDLAAQLVRGASMKDDGTYVWDVPTTGSNAYAAGHQFVFRVNFSTSGEGTIPADRVHVTIPKSILTKRDGTKGDTMELSVPSEADVKAAEEGTGEELDDDIDWAWRETDDGIEIYNFREVDAGTNAYIEVGYSTNDTSFAYKDTEENTDFTAHMEIVNGNPDETIEKDADPISTSIDTTAEISRTNKSLPTKYNEWQSVWDSADKPENPDDYIYLVWTITSDITATQPYNFTLADTVKGYHGTSKQDAVESTDPMKVIGYRFSGGVWQESGTVLNQTQTNTRYDYVLTSVPKEEYEQYTWWQAVNSITSTVDPVDQADNDTSKTARREYVWTRPVFSPPIGYVNVYKRGDASYRAKRDWPIHRSSTLDFQNGNYSRYDLEAFNGYDGKTKTLDTYDGFDYASWAVGYTYPWTTDTTDDSSSYGQKKVTTTLIDEGLYLAPEENLETLVKNGSPYTKGTKLTSDDYRIDTLEFAYYEMDGKLDEETQRFTGVEADYSKGDNVITFYGKFGTSDEWVKFGTFTVTGKNTGTADFDSSYVKSSSADKLVFQDNVDLTAYKLETSNARYYTELYTVPFVTLKNSETVKSVINSSVSSMALVNNNSATWTKEDGTEIATEYDADIDYACAAQRDSSLTKEVVSTANNPRKRTYTITWKLQEEETVITGEDSEPSYVPQASGVFYDLLPEGAVLDRKSVQVNDPEGNEIKAFKVQTEDNYNGTGRTMVRITVNAPADYYTVYFDTKHTWNAIKDYGTDVYNPLAYETGNDEIADGFADNGGSVNSDGTVNTDAIQDAELMSKLTPSTDDDDVSTTKKFIYAEESYDISALTSASAGLAKKVRADRDTKYETSTMTTVNGDYSYQLRYQNSTSSKVRDMILYDSLENYDLTGTSASEAVGESGWRGTLKSIDVNQLVSMGADPVVYISTKDRLSLQTTSGNKPTAPDQDTDTWIRVTDTTDLSGAKAVAIDFRKAEDGSDFVLEPGQSVTAYLYMKAPDTAPAAEAGTIPYAYNNVFAQNYLFDADDPENGQEFYIHQDYTKIGLKAVGNFSLEKVSSENENTKIEGVSFRLRGTSKYGTSVDRIETTDANGNIDFTEVEMGEYVLQEYESVPDYLLDTTEHKVIVDNKGKVTIDGTDYTDGVIRLTDQPRVHGDLTFMKKNYDGYTISGVQFHLYGTSSYGNDVSKYAESDNGIVRIKDIEQGTYTLVETKTTDAYLPGEDTYQVVVDENGLASITGILKDGVLISDTETDSLDVKKQVVYNYDRYWLAGLRKEDADTQAYLSGAEFSLKGMSDAGTKVDETYTTDGNGLIVFAKDGKAFLEAGKYVVKEIKAPTYKSEDGTKDLSYLQDNNSYILTITKEGEITLTKEDGTALETEDQTGYFIFPNTKAKEGKVTIIKKWDDGLTGDAATNRTPPVIHLRTTEPEIQSDEAGEKAGFFEEETSSSASASETAADKENAENPLLSVWDKLTGAVEAEAAEITASGTWGTCPWTIDSDGVLTIGEGTGAEQDARKFVSPWSEYASEITAVKTSGKVIAPQNCHHLFYCLNNVTSMDLTGFDTSNVTKMNAMFSDCSGLTSLDLSGFDTSKVTSMSSMFSNCKSLTNLNLSSFDTSKVTGMHYMFQNCSSLTSLDLSSFDTSKVTGMSQMFNGCSGLTSLDLSNFDTSSLRDSTGIEYMFNGCSSLTSLNLSSFNTSGVTSMRSLFRGCSSLTSLNLSSFDTSNVKYMTSMFEGCSSLTSLDLTNFDTSNVKNMYGMFKDCSGLTSLDLSNFNTSNVTGSPNTDSGMTFMFSGCSGLTSLDLSNFDTSNVQTMKYMFQYCSGLTSLNLTGSFNTSNVKSMRQMFYGCSDLTSLDLSNFDTSNVTDMSMMFSSSLEKITFGQKWNKVLKKTSIDGSNKTWIKTRDVNGNKLTDSPATKLSAITDVTELPGTWTVEGYIEHNVLPDGGIEYVSEDDKWTKLDDGTWTYTFDVYDDTVDYWVYEEAIEGYTSDAMYPSYVLVDETQPRQAVITNKATNPPSEPETGSLTVGKSVSGGTTDRKFTFHITLSDTEAATGTKIYSDIVFTDGEADVMLGNGDTLTISGLPEGTKYTVTEEEDTSYDSSGENAEGTISTSGSTASFTNTYVPPTEETVPLHLKKKVTGRFTESGSYTFRVALEGLKPDASYESPDGLFVADASGRADLEAKLADGETWSLDQLPKNCTYQITEVGAEDCTSSYQITGSANTSSDTSVREDTDLSTARETLDEEETVTFTNDYNPKQDLTIEKVYQDTAGNEIESNERFAFSILFSGLEESDSFSSSVGRITADELGADGTYQTEKEFYLRGGESVTFRDIPVGVTYRITEEGENNSNTASYKVEGTAVEKESDAVTHTHLDLTTAAETVDQGENGAVTFTNTKPDTASLQIKKTGADGESLSGAEFTVRLGDKLIETMETKEDGTTDVLDGLEVGKMYTVSETKAPDGYMYAVPQSFTVAAEQAGTTITLTFTDKKLAELPDSGGSGRNLAVMIILTGCAMACACLYILLADRKRKRY
ncbi:MAG: BspA family leucine-rich repeat surface protein [Bilifractor sp.]|jgi:surface protein